MGRGSGIVGYNVQSAVEGEHHLTVAHEVLADRGYFSGEEILACETMGVTPYVPKP